VVEAGDDPQPRVRERAAEVDRVAHVEVPVAVAVDEEGRRGAGSDRVNAIIRSARPRQRSAPWAAARRRPQRPPGSSSAAAIAAVIARTSSAFHCTFVPSSARRSTRPGCRAATFRATAAPRENPKTWARPRPAASISARTFAVRRSAVSGVSGKASEAPWPRKSRA
jgi:hypothetical protein